MIAPTAVTNQLRILIVDDERHNRQLLEIMLSAEGLLFQSAASGEEALAMVAEQPPDLILLDIMMPHMDGYQVVANIKGNAATRNIPVIMVTALDDRNSRLRGLSAGAEEFISKPVDRTELCVRVRNLSRLKGYGDQKYSDRIEGEVDSRTAVLLGRTKTLEEQADVLTEQAALLDLALDAIIVRDMDNRILFWSRGAEAMFGWTGTEANGRNKYELLRTKFSQPVEHIDAMLLRQRQWEGEAICHKRDGTPVTVACRCAVKTNSDGAPVGILAVINDITVRRQTEVQLRLLTERLSLATAVARVGVWDWDLATSTLTWDSTMFAIYGFVQAASIPYERWASSIVAEDRPVIESTLQSTISVKGQSEAEFRMVMPDGTIRCISTAQRVLLDEHGNVSRVIGVNIDVTERKHAEEALEQVRADGMRFKDEFLSHVSHELRSPLTAIKQFTGILVSGVAGELNKEQRQYQDIVLKNIGQLQSMIDDLLEVTRLETGKLTVEPESTSVPNAVIEIVKTLEETARGKGVTLACELPSDLPKADADRIRLRQVLIILLDNAIKFTPEGGKVFIRAGVQPEDPGFLLIQVSDTGCGITRGTADRIFERLYQVSERVQASRKGLGLGLYICKELVTRQGGRIWVETQQGNGSTFAFTLPIFSLQNEIAPFLKELKWPATTVAIVTVEVNLRGAWPSRESREKWSGEARALIRRCILPDLDVLLPRMRLGVEAECFSVAAFADDNGASVLADRIRQQCERLPHLEQTGLTFSVSHRMLPDDLSESGASAERLVARMAIRIEEAVKTYVCQGGNQS